MLKNFFQRGKYLLILFALLFSLFTIVRILFTFDLFDFHTVYYQSIQNLLHGHGLYNDPTNDVNYPPTTFLFFLPFGLLPLPLAEKVWTIISFSTLCLSIYILLKTLAKHVSMETYLLLYSFAMLSFPVKFTLGLGQINLFILLLVSLCFSFYYRRQFFLAGVMLGVACALKLTPLFLLLFFLRKNNWRVIVVSIATFLIAALLAIVFFGSMLTQQYIRDVLPHIPTVGNNVYYNQAFTGFLARALIPDQLAWILNCGIFGILLIVSFLLTESKKQSSHIELVEYGLFITTILIGAGLSWQHHFVLLVIPYTAVFVMLLKEKQKILTIFVLTISYLLVAFNIKNPENYHDIFTFFLSHVFYGTMLLFFLLVNQARKRSLS